MRAGIDHLPAVQQAELDRATDTLLAEFARAKALASQPWKRNGQVLKIILFGSYARDDWVDEPANGYQSDFDLLVVVNHADLTDVADYWFVAEDLIQRDPAIARPVNTIVHSLDDVNQGLSRGEYFWTDIARDGIVLHEVPGTVLAMPKALTAADAFEMATAYHADWIGKVDRAVETAAVQCDKGLDDAGWRKDTAFTLHQATERAYVCFLLVRTLYFPRSHNIKFLRSLAEDSEPRLIAAWPRTERADRRRFELLKRAYVEARYSPNFGVSVDDLTALMASVRRLRDLVDEVSRETLDDLRVAAGFGPAH